MLFVPLQWLPELQHYAPGVPIVLVGTKLGELCDSESTISILLHISLAVIIELVCCTSSV